MPRKTRIEYEGAVYHVISRGNYIHLNPVRARVRTLGDFGRLALDECGLADDLAPKKDGVLSRGLPDARWRIEGCAGSQQPVDRETAEYGQSVQTQPAGERLPGKPLAL